MSVQNKPAKTRESSSVDDSDLSKLVFRHFFAAENPAPTNQLPTTPAPIFPVPGAIVIPRRRGPPQQTLPASNRARNRVSRERSLTFLRFHFKSFISLIACWSSRSLAIRRPLTCPRPAPVVRAHASRRRLTKPVCDAFVARIRSPRGINLTLIPPNEL